MPLRYAHSQAATPLVQGEILGELYEYRLVHPASVATGTQPQYLPIPHPRIVVLTNVCDLEQDFAARNIITETTSDAGGEAEEAAHETTDQSTPLPAAVDDPSFVPYVLLCDLYEREAIKSRPKINSDIMRRIRQNQDERFHCLAAAPIGDDEEAGLPEVYVDFRKTLAVPTPSIYDAINLGAVKRIAIIPDVYMHDLVHRYYSYLSRVGIPN